MENRKTVRLIELFSGIGAQAAAIKRTNIPHELYKTSEWEINAVASYKAIHFENDNTDYSAGMNKDALVTALETLCISTDGKKPLDHKQIARKDEKWLRTVYNNFRATHNMGSVTKIKAADLEIEDKESFIYLLSYSFPCQDLSLAGKGKGMSRDGGTRSGLLWEVERILQECGENRPQVLLMENVPQVHGKKNMADFNEWCHSLEKMGYFNYWEDLNAKDYGVAQNRNRCFMVSLLNPTLFRFPTPIPLNKCLADYLDEDVDERYFVNSEKANDLLQKLKEDGKLE